MKKAMFETDNDRMVYKVRPQNGPVSGTVTVPGSKSITNRALLIAALAEGRSELSGVLFSDDSRHFLGSLQSLGFDVAINEEEKIVTVMGLGGKIPSKNATINVGSAGTAARFLTAMLALSDGEHTIECSEQMKKRPMKPLFDALTAMGASFEYLEQEGYLPVKVTGNKGQCSEATMDITKSTQFLSALLMVGPMTDSGMTIKITSDKKDGAYIRITRNMMEQFGVSTSFDGEIYTVPAVGDYNNRDYYIEPDMSAACYFYAMAALTGGVITVRGVHKDIIQGDVKFLGVLEQLGCTLTHNEEGIQVIGPKGGVYAGIEVDMNDFSDQTMTLASLAVYATSPTIIRNVSHIRLQESDRMQAIINELTRIGIKCSADGKNITIIPGQPHGADIETYDDHRMSMAFTLLGLKTEGIIIVDPMCCRKTFENYFDVLETLLVDR